MYSLMYFTLIELGFVINEEKELVYEFNGIRLTGFLKNSGVFKCHKSTRLFENKEEILKLLRNFKNSVELLPKVNKTNLFWLIIPIQSSPVLTLVSNSIPTNDNHYLWNFKYDKSIIGHDTKWVLTSF